MSDGYQKLADDRNAAVRGDIPMPSRVALQAAVDAANVHPLSLAPEHVAELIEAARWALHVAPVEIDFCSLTPQNPLNQVYFRAGLLACREYMARFVEQGGHPE